MRQCLPGENAEKAFHHVHPGSVRGGIVKRQLRLGGIAAVLETRLHQAQAEAMSPIDFLSCLVSDELTRRGDRLLERRSKQAKFSTLREPSTTSTSTSTRR
jgi:hypothetical protein